MEEKLECSKCKELKDRNEFFLRSDRPRGCSSYCKKCFMETSKGSFKSRKSNQLFKLKSLETDTHKLCTCCNKYKEKSEFTVKRKLKSGNSLNHTCKTCSTIKHRVRKYNLSLEEALLMLHEQNGVCKICGKQNDRDRDLCIDHDHETNKVRGMLCHKCNSGLGMFNDNLELLEKATLYLKYHKELK